MSSKLSDINDIFFAAGNTQPSGAVITGFTGVAVDMATAANNNCFAIMNIGTVAGTETVFIGKVQEATSSTAGTGATAFTDISGAVFSTMTSTTGAQIIQTINFQRSQRYVRFVSTIAGTTAGVALDVLFAGQKGQL